MLRKRHDDAGASRDERASHEKRSGLRRSKRSRQLFTNQHNPLVAEIDVDQPVENMAASIQQIIQLTLEDPRTSMNRVSLTDDLSGIKLQRAVDEDPCVLNGKVRFMTQRIKGLQGSVQIQDMHIVYGSEDYEPMVDDASGRTTGYKWNGVWKVTLTVDAFKVDVMSQVDVDACGTPLDFTCFGAISVNGTVVEATIRVDGELSDDLSKGDLKIESAQVIQQAVQFDTVSEMGGLKRHLPLNYEGELNSLIEYLFNKKLSNLVISSLPTTADTQAQR